MYGRPLYHISMNVAIPDSLIMQLVKYATMDKRTNQNSPASKARATFSGRPECACSGQHQRTDELSN